MPARYICEGVRDALHPREIRTCCSERASLAWIGTDARKWSGQEAGSTAIQSWVTATGPLALLSSLRVMLEKNKLPSAFWHHTPTEGIAQLIHFQTQRFWMLFPQPHCSPTHAAEPRPAHLSSVSTVITPAPLFMLSLLSQCPSLLVLCPNSLFTQDSSLRQCHSFSAHGDIWSSSPYSSSRQSHPV